MNISKATVSDIDEIAILFDQYRQFYECPADLGAAKSYLNKRLNNQESTVFLARNSNGNAVGFVGGLKTPKKSSSGSSH